MNMLIKTLNALRESPCSITGLMDILGTDKAKTVHYVITHLRGYGYSIARDEARRYTLTSERYGYDFKSVKSIRLDDVLTSDFKCMNEISMQSGIKRKDLSTYLRNKRMQGYVIDTHNGMARCLIRPH